MGDGKSPWCSSFGSSRFFFGGRLAAPKNSIGPTTHSIIILTTSRTDWTELVVAAVVVVVGSSFLVAISVLQCVWPLSLPSKLQSIVSLYLHLHSLLIHLVLLNCYLCDPIRVQLGSNCYY